MAATKKATEEVAKTIVDATAEEIVEKKPAKTTKRTSTKAKTAKADADATEATEEKATAKKTTKKTTTRKSTKKVAEPTVDFYVEFNGVQESYANVIENVKNSYLENNEGAEIKSIKIYLKPTENAAYCVINDEAEFRMDVYFC